MVEETVSSYTLAPHPGMACRCKQALQIPLSQTGAVGLPEWHHLLHLALSKRYRQFGYYFVFSDFIA
jgi:hypothetical protein